MINGSIKLFRAFGIDVFLHWSWFVVAVFLIPNLGAGWFTGPGNTPMLWSALLYIALFGIVVLHEFGHALACRSVGGQAKHIVLWPLGGVAFVQPPQRPGAVLWSIVAGPLVNVMLVPVTVGAHILISGTLLLPDGATNLQAFVFSLMLMNAGLLVFNMLPIVPLDGSRVADFLVPLKFRPQWEAWVRLGPLALLGVLIVPALLGLDVFAPFVAATGFVLMLVAGG